MNNSIYLRRRSKIVPPASGSELLPMNYVASVAKNLGSLGHGLSPALMEACRSLTIEQLTGLYRFLFEELQRSKGAHKRFEPMYPNFPEQVMDMSECELYMNAIIHYWTDGEWLPTTKKNKRSRLADEVELKMIDLGSEEEFEGLFTRLVSANTSLSGQDEEDLAWFVEHYGDEIERLLPSAVPQKETVAHLAALLLEHTSNAEELIARFAKTATDVLRIAVGFSKGDVSLANPTKFRSFTRKERRLLLGLLESMGNRTEDMLRWKPRWIRLGERLHPGEYAKKFPGCAESFDILRNDMPFSRFNSLVENAIRRMSLAEAVDALSHRPGDFARRLDHLLRVSAETHDQVATAFAQVADRVSTPVLLQVRKHFATRGHRASVRVFFPKGDLGKARGVPNMVPSLPERLCGRIATLCEETLLARFSQLPPLGKTYVDDSLKSFMAPFAMRSASKALRTVARGSRLPLPERCNVLRFFIWWKNGRDRTDVDLSATMFDGDFNFRDIVSYYNLTSVGGHHSGDIVDAPKGACEFIDITLDRVRKQGVRYVVMTLTSYTQQPYVELPECFAGWMARSKPNSGEIFEPKTVEDRLDLSAETTIALPLIIDVVDRVVIWCDISLRKHPYWQNNVHANMRGVQMTMRSLIHLRKTNLYELLALHARARGEMVSSAAEADTVFSVEAGTPYKLEEVASQYMA